MNKIKEKETLETLVLDNLLSKKELYTKSNRMPSGVGGIYKIRFLKGTEKEYVGQAEDFRRRQSHHFYRSLNDNARSHRKAISNALNKYTKQYGIENVVFEIIEVVENKSEKQFTRDLNSREKYHIKKLNTLAPNGYNLTDGGDSAKPSDETRKKQSKAKKGLYLGSKNYKAVSVRQYGLDGKFIKEHGCIRDAEREIGVTGIQCACSGGTNTIGGFQWRYARDNIDKLKPAKIKERRVRQYTLDGKFVKEFESVREAEKETKCPAVYAVCRGRADITGGFQWRYADENLKSVPKYNGRDHSYKRKLVRQYGLDGRFIREFESIAEASVSVGLSKKNNALHSALSGQSMSSCGYQWRYGDCKDDFIGEIVRGTEKKTRAISPRGKVLEFRSTNECVEKLSEMYKPTFLRKYVVSVCKGEKPHYHKWKFEYVR